MSKIKGQSSTEYGESLLGEMQASNERIRKDNQSSAQKRPLGVRGVLVFKCEQLKMIKSTMINDI